MAVHAPPPPAGTGPRRQLDPVIAVPLLLALLVAVIELAKATA